MYPVSDAISEHTFVSRGQLETLFFSVGSKHTKPADSRDFNRGEPKSL